MFPFAGYWESLDINDRLSLGLQTAEGAAQERYWRGQIRSAWLSNLQKNGGENQAQAALEALLRHLAASPAWMFIVNLEDLWQEKQPQNVPSTKDERPNWRRPARYSLEEFCQLPQVVGTLRQLARWRRAGSKGKGK
jgi:4-alpha-glucanotransferase